ncbi:MAG: acetate--CoA ligase family protein [Candidatus Heimdallarchaeota archaeon]|nr:acetate--CoA ligase family protein [Candidatus Heimdallarchaeota archaeon]MCK4876320.1 acetate--CoA ligase family protein [Candidatus Heimdallarchaeota archaeon]
MSEEISLLLKQIKDLNRETLTYEESRKIMKLAEIPLNQMYIARDVREGIEKANKIGYPIVMKIISEDVIHKSDSGGVKVAINSDDDLKIAYDEMIESVKKYYPDAKIEGVSIEEMVKGVELLIGINTDLQFGKMIAFGIGGVFVEVYKDVSFRLIPVTKQDIEEMIDEIEGKTILDGYRGMPEVNKEELILLILKISKLIEENPSIKEMDLNPVVGTEDGLKAIDARIILG